MAREEPAAQELALEAGRVADRLRVLGPRWAHRDRAADVAEVDLVRTHLQRLADLAAAAQGQPPRRVPELALYALADQVLVLAHEAAEAGAGGAATLLLSDLRRRL